MALPKMNIPKKSATDDTQSAVPASQPAGKPVWVPRRDGTWELAYVDEVPPVALDFSHWNGIRLW